MALRSAEQVDDLTQFLSTLSGTLLFALKMNLAQLYNSTNISEKFGLYNEIGAYAEATRIVQARRSEIDADYEQHRLTPSYRERVSHLSKGGISILELNKFNREVVEQVVWAESQRKHNASVEDYPSAMALSAAASILQRNVGGSRDAGRFEQSPYLLDRSTKVGYEDFLTLEDIRSEPGRPQQWTEADGSILTHKSNLDLIHDDDCMCRFLHFIAVDVELCGAEVCIENALGYGSLPTAFYLDMARQVSDELRHATIVSEILGLFGGKIGDYEYSNAVLKRSGECSTLPERIAVQQVIQEGNGIEASEKISELFVTFGYKEFATSFEYIKMDEVEHASIGNRWLRYLLDGNEEKYIELVQRMSETIRLFPGAKGWSHPMRRHAGFSEGFFQNFSSRSRNK